MIIEYILLLTVFVVILYKAVYLAPARAFREASPRLGARVEKHLITGAGFESNNVRPISWKSKSQ